jgi:hypothetical protein
MKDEKAARTSEWLRFGRGPALAHQAEQVGEGVFVGDTALGDELPRALVELRGHLGGLGSGAAEREERLGELLEFGFSGGHELI